MKCRDCLNYIPEESWCDLWEDEMKSTAKACAEIVPVNIEQPESNKLS
jgi:hypothetical protein